MASEQTLPMVTGGEAKTPRSRLGAGFASLGVLIVVFWFIARHFHLEALRDYPVSTFISFAFLFGPYWLFGFGAGDALRRLLRSPSLRISAAALLTLPYFVLALPRGDFHWPLAAPLVAIAVFSAALLQAFPKAGNWADVLVLAVAGLNIDLGLLNTAGPLARTGAALWPAGLGGFPKMMMADVALYCYLVVKPIDGFGYDLVPR